MVDAEDFPTALSLASLMGMNPGGGVVDGFIIEPDHPAFKVLPRNRVLSLEELNEFGYHTERQKRKMS
jgi:hypothetical protein